MSEERLTLQEEFDLRERRIKLMYPILYAAAVVWMSLILLLVNGSLIKDLMPVFCGIITLATLIILKIAKYALFELQCLKINEKVSENMKLQTDKMYDNIWVSSVVTMALTGILVALHMRYTTWLSNLFLILLLTISILVLALSEFAYSIVSVKKHKKKNLLGRNLEAVFQLISFVTTPIVFYCVYVLCCQGGLFNA